MSVIVLNEQHAIATVMVDSVHRLANLADFSLPGDSSALWSLVTSSGAHRIMMARQESLPAKARIHWLALRDLWSSPLQGITAEQLWEIYIIALLGGFRPHAADFGVSYFGSDAKMASHLAHLIVRGRKRATTSRRYWYEQDKLPLPRVGERVLVTDYFGIPSCFIKTIAVSETNFAAITPDQAAAEGEGDLSLAHWRQVHRAFFDQECQQEDMVFTEDETLIYEEFVVDHVLRPFEATAETRVIDAQLRAYNQRDPEAFAKYYADPVILHHVMTGKTSSYDRQRLRDHYAEFFRASPKLFCEIRAREQRGSLVTDTEFIYGYRGGADMTKAIVTYEVIDQLITRVWFT